MEENTSAPTTNDPNTISADRRAQMRLNPDPIKMSFADELSDAALAWLVAGRSGNFENIEKASARLWSITSALETALNARENGPDNERL